MILLKQKTKKSINLININIKYNNNILYLLGKFGYIKNYLYINNFYLNLFFIRKSLKILWFELNSGWIGFLYLNGIGFRATRKKYLENDKFWRFNVGHSHVFKYFSPINIFVKIKNRYICIFGYKKKKIFDIANKLRTFHVPDCYKGVGIKFPKEIIRLKKGKVRQ